ncbi:MAG: hypothetical protein WCE27_17010, partial [Pseudolabrys sp.]
VSGAGGAIAVPFAPAIASGTAAADTSVTRALCWEAELTRFCRNKIPIVNLVTGITCGTRKRA